MQCWRRTAWWSMRCGRRWWRTLCRCNSGCRRPACPAPGARRSNAIAGGAPVVDALVITSVWAVHLLRTLSQVNITPVLFNAHWSLEEEGSAPVSKMNAAPAPSRGGHACCGCPRHHLRLSHAFFQGTQPGNMSLLLQDGQFSHSHTDLHHTGWNHTAVLRAGCRSSVPSVAPCYCSTALLACVACDVRHMRQHAEAAHECAGEELQNPCGAGDRRCGRLCCHSF